MPRGLPLTHPAAPLPSNLPAEWGPCSPVSVPKGSLPFVTEGATLSKGPTNSGPPHV